MAWAEKENQYILSWREGSEGWALIWLSWPCGLPCLWEKRKMTPEVDHFCQIHNNIHLVLSYIFSEVLFRYKWLITDEFWDCNVSNKSFCFNGKSSKILIQKTWCKYVLIMSKYVFIIMFSNFALIKNFFYVYFITFHSSLYFRLIFFCYEETIHFSD